jgi:hypothetical protein
MNNCNLPYVKLLPNFVLWELGVDWLLPIVIGLVKWWLNYLYIVSECMNCISHHNSMIPDSPMLASTIYLTSTKAYENFMIFHHILTFCLFCAGELQDTVITLGTCYLHCLLVYLVGWGSFPIPLKMFILISYKKNSPF